MEKSQFFNKQWYESANGSHTALPEKVLQFGTGVLLRGLPDFFIDKANKQGLFNGSIAIVKSTSTGGVSDFEQQNNFYHHQIKGIIHGQEVNEVIINTSISRVLEATTQWQEIIQIARSPLLKLVISNTTEAGIVFDPADIFTTEAPVTFPGKLLSVLWHRWNFFGKQANQYGLVILPTELIPDNGAVLKKIVLDLAAIHHFTNDFIQWINADNDFCNTLVDRIVTANNSEAAQLELQKQLGYQDKLLITSEPFALWAIETQNASTLNALSFFETESQVVVAPSILKFRELKLRLLNATHSFCCAIAILANFETVKEAMLDTEFKNFITYLINDEISPCVISSEISSSEVNDFGKGVLDRFSNPNIEHKWKNIATSYVEKIKMRNIYLLDKYQILKNEVPRGMCICMAAFFVYENKIKGNKEAIDSFSLNENFTTQLNNYIYLIQENGIKTVVGEFLNSKL